MHRRCIFCGNSLRIILRVAEWMPRLTFSATVLAPSFTRVPNLSLGPQVATGARCAKNCSSAAFGEGGNRLPPGTLLRWLRWLILRFTALLLRRVLLLWLLTVLRLVLRGLCLCLHPGQITLQLLLKLLVGGPGPSDGTGDLMLLNTMGFQLLQRLAAQHFDLLPGDGVDPHGACAPDHAEHHRGVRDEHAPEGLRVIILGHVEDDLHVRSGLHDVHAQACAIQNINMFVDRSVQLLGHLGLSSLHILHVTGLVHHKVFFLEHEDAIQLEVFESLDDDGVPLIVSAENT
mmetsp:Transcript_33111/g.55425  ORF Transcript_33111/g.55425 Transcript_33111/m.55425 type:complete len:289 (-) Transcript_33111:360-1226(-)